MFFQKCGDLFKKSTKDYMFVNGTGVEIVETEHTVIQSLERINIYLPRFCYHAELSIAGNCRMCLVESIGAIKPLIACANTSQKNMKIGTNSIVVLKSREYILEFLLINHPLDCPICDQGGECDLQDITAVFGSDRGRFKETKRSVLDKDFGVMLKTIMTRCIHCTRCIRFSSELVGTNYLGVFGRGELSEVGTYVNRLVDSPLSGNLIDLCPVGAITSKPYAFKARPWELTTVETIDILDSLCSSIRVDIRGNEVMRILPVLNNDLNQSWISDKIRFSYDSFHNQRLYSPVLLNSSKEVISYSWEYSFNEIKKRITRKYFISNNLSNVYFFTGDLIDLFTTQSSWMFTSILGIKNINIHHLNHKCVDLRSSYVFKLSFLNIIKCNVFLVVGLSFQDEIPLLGLRLRKQTILKKDKVLFCYIGTNIKSNLNNWVHIGLTNSKYLCLYLGKSFYCINLFMNLVSKSQISMISGSNSWVGSSSMDESGLLFKLGSLLNLNISYNYLTLFTSEVHESEIFLYSDYRRIMRSTTLSEPKLIYCVGFDKSFSMDQFYFWRQRNRPIVIYQGHTGGSCAEYANIILPTTMFTEKSSHFLNCENRIVHSTECTQPTGSSWVDELIFFSLLTYFNNKDNFLSVDDWYHYYINRVPFLAKINKFVSSSHFIDTLYSSLVKNSLSSIKWSKSYYICRVNNYYKSDIISKVSINLARCSILHKKNRYFSANFII